jgi:hypothetical protein
MEYTGPRQMAVPPMANLEPVPPLPVAAVLNLTAAPHIGQTQQTTRRCTPTAGAAAGGGGGRPAHALQSLTDLAVSSRSVKERPRRIFASPQSMRCRRQHAHSAQDPAQASGSVARKDLADGRPTLLTRALLVRHQGFRLAGRKHNG